MNGFSLPVNISTNIDNARYVAHLNARFFHRLMKASACPDFLDFHSMPNNIAIRHSVTPKLRSIEV